MSNPLGRAYPLKFTGYVIIFVLAYLILPNYLALIIPGRQFKILLLFYLLNVSLIYYLLRRFSVLNYALDFRMQELNEKTNILDAEYTRKKQNNLALQENFQRINNLKNILEKISQGLDLDLVAEILANDAFSLIGRNKGVCLLYLVESRTQKLGLFKTKKEDLSMVIKTKEGSIFDLWVLRHSTPLLIEDIKNDFRFDVEKFKELDMRSVLSLVSSPLISENKFLGILRLDSQIQKFFNQDDLRFLVAISDLGAVAIENSELFKKTQELAIRDALTGFYSKGYFLERLKEECTRSKHLNRSLIFIMVDIDLFKNYNDEFGHMAGDIVLKKVSQLILESLGSLNPLISRFGGEEFCIVVSGLSKVEAFNAAEKLRKAIEKERILLRRTETHVTVSIGLAELSAEIVDEVELIRSSDKAMYQAKQKGRNQVCCI